MQASIVQLKAKLSAYINQVRQGEEVLVTDRGGPVARLIPYQARAGEHAELLHRLAKEGTVRLPTAPSRSPWPLPSVKSSASVLQALLEERSEEGNGVSER